MGVHCAEAFSESDCDDFFTCVNGDVFAKLISKLTSLKIILELSEDNKQLFVLSGNSKYPFPVYSDMDSSRPIAIKYPDFHLCDHGVTVSGSQLKTITTYNKNCISPNNVLNPLYGNYYVDKDGVITFDEVQACVNNNVHITDNTFMLRKETVNLLDVFGTDDVDVQIDNKLIRFSNGYIDIIGTLLNDAEKFPAQPLKELAQTNSKDFLKVNKKELIGCLDRLLLFVDERDMFSAKVVFNKDNIIFNGYTNAELVETVACTESSITESNIQYINVKSLRTQIAVCVDDVIKLCFGSDIGLTIESDGIIQFVPYLDADDDEIVE
jgi:hypothetical protein